MKRLPFHGLRPFSTAKIWAILASVSAFSFGACSKDDDTGQTGDGDGDSQTGGDGGMGGNTSVDTTKRIYEADDAKIQYMGRFDFTDPKAPVTTAAAANVTIRFEGDSVTALIKDQFRYNKYRNYFDVMVDGEILGKVALEKNETSVSLVSGLKPGVHVLTMVRRTEPQIGEWTFLGFEIGGTLLEPAPLPARKIAVIGDSITAGSGIEAANNSAECSLGAFEQEASDGWGIPFHNANLAYGPIAARMLDAQFHVAGVSGIGLIRNYTSVYDIRPMPAVYDLLYLEKDPLAGLSGGGGMGGMIEIGEEHLWDHDLYVPDAIVVALGTNDFSLGDSTLANPRPDISVEEFTAAYIEFVDKLRSYHPEATFFGMTSPMLGDGWPRSGDTFLTDHRNAISAVEAHYDAEGFAGFHPIQVEKVSGGGCGTHPDVEEHAEMAEVIAEAIAEAMGW